MGLFRTAFAAALVTMAVSLPAMAATMKAVYTGTVSDSYDETDSFGNGTGTGVLDGLSFTLTAIYNPDHGIRSEYDDGFNANEDAAGGSGLGGPTFFQSIALEINGVTRFIASGYYAYMIAYDYTPAGQSAFQLSVVGYDEPSPSTFVNYGAVNASILSLPGNIEPDLDRGFDLIPDPVTDQGFGGFRLLDFYDPSTGEFSGSTFGQLTVASLSVSRIGPTAIPLPASALLLFGALGGLGALRLRRRAA